MFGLLPPLKASFDDDNGNPLTNGRLYSYIAGSTTPVDTFTDASGSTTNDNPIVLNARGEANVWLSDQVVYKFVLEDSLGNEIYSVDNVRVSGGSVGGTSSDELVKVSLADVTAGYLADKLVAGNKIILTTLGTGSLESLRISLDDLFASDISNNSTVSGVSVREALNQLKSDIDSIVVPVTSVNGETGDVIISSGDIPDDSSVGGSRVRDSLNILNNAINNINFPVTSVNALTGDVVINSDNISNESNVSGSSVSDALDDLESQIVSKTDELVKVSSTDVNSGYLEDKVQAGQNINITKVITAGDECLKFSSPSTTAGVLDTFFLTGDQVTTSLGTFYETSNINKGSVALVTQVVSNNDNQKQFYSTDILSIVVSGIPRKLKAGKYDGNLTCQVSGNGADQRWGCEVYLADADGNPEDSGITNAPIGDLGKEVLANLDSAIIDLVANNPSDVLISGFLTEDFEIPVNKRLRLHYYGEKVGVSGGVFDYSIFQGQNANSFINVASAIVSADVEYDNTTSGLNSENVQDALDEIVSGYVTIATDQTITGTKTLTKIDFVDSSSANFNLYANTTNNSPTIEVGDFAKGHVKNAVISWDDDGTGGGTEIKLQAGQDRDNISDGGSVTISDNEVTIRSTDDDGSTEFVVNGANIVAKCGLSQLKLQPNGYWIVSADLGFSSTPTQLLAVNSSGVLMSGNSLVPNPSDYVTIATSQTITAPKTLTAPFTFNQVGQAIKLNDSFVKWYNATGTTSYGEISNPNSNTFRVEAENGANLLLTTSGGGFLQVGVGAINSTPATFGLGVDSNGFLTQFNPSGGGVTSVNGQTGVVQLNAPNIPYTDPNAVPIDVDQALDFLYGSFSSLQSQVTANTSQLGFIQSTYLNDLVAGTGISITGTGNTRTINATGKGTESFNNPSALSPDASQVKQSNANQQAQSLTINSPSNGSDGDKVIIRIEASSTSSLTWSGSYNDLKGVLPSQAQINKIIYVGMIYNGLDSAWDIVSVVEQN